MNRYIRIHPKDNVVVALMDIKAGEVFLIEDSNLVVQEDIPVGHKMALVDIAEDENIIKYGFPIGHACRKIKKGELVNDKNIETNLKGKLDYVYNPKKTPQLSIKGKEKLSFRGYRRKNGDVGIRNEIWIVPTVGCVNGIINQLAESLREETACKNRDAIVAYPHSYGCSQLGEDHENTRKILRNLVLHPNAGAVLVVGLGCENNQPEAFKEFLGNYDTDRIKFLVAQNVEDEYEEGMKILRELYELVSQDQREEIPLSELNVGLKCGGSDGFSGITANPLLGFFSDFLVSQGGTTVLTEVPEMFGAETMLLERCRNQAVFHKTVQMINEFKDYFIRNEQPIYENPSPGNKAGGISTLEEKSLGCTQKSGMSRVNDVLMYGDRLQTKGLNLLYAPGNDLVASTALAASGCHIVLFTTGRGTPFGTFIPTLKVATHSDLYHRKRNWMDFNSGTLLEGESMESLGKRFIRYVIDVASGVYVNNEKKDYRDIAIFKTGVTL
mgnify:CR=1 FL=1